MNHAIEQQVILLGPQRQQQTVANALADLDIGGPVATITAGWEEREQEDAGMSRDLGGRTRNLGLYPRAEEIYREDPAVQALMHERQDRRRQLRALYRLRLGPQLHTCRVLLGRTDPEEPDALYGPEIDSAIAGVRTLDQHHLERIGALEAEIANRLAEDERPSIERHRFELAGMLDETEALLIAGGNVDTLMSLLRLFNLLELAVGKPVIAWSGGAMVIGEQVVLFHDSPPQGPGDAEIHGPGFGLAQGVIPLPHARHRLRLDDPARVALFARRFAPATCITLDYGGRIDRGRSQSDWVPTGGASILRSGGQASGSSVETGGDVVDVRGWPADDPAPASADGVDAGRFIQGLTAAAEQGPEAIDRALESSTFPIVGNGWALFVYRGWADEVKLHHWLSGLPSAQPFQPIPGTDLWVLQIEIQERARIEYKFEVVEGDRRELLLDPLNTTLAHDPFGANSVVQGIGYRTPHWSIEQPTTRRGRVEHASLASEAFGEERPYSVYLPARFRTTRRYPLLIIHDGLDYTQYADLITVLDNLIHRLEIPPLIAALIQSPNRTTEYVADERHARFVVDELVPALEEQLPILGDSRDRGLLGASLGAVASLHTAWSRPGAFGKLLLQSGSFAFTDIGDHDLGPIFDPVVEFVNRFRKDPGQPGDQIFLSVGIYESLIYFNRSLLPDFQRTGADVRLVEAQDGHNWQNWRDQLREGLTWLFPGPLWMDYE